MNRGAVAGRPDLHVDASSGGGSQRERVTEVVAEVAAHRAVIDQAKGMLSLVYGIDADSAFALLRWRSQTANVKLRALAAQLLVDFRSVSSDPALPPRSTFDRLLLTGHERVLAGE